MDELKLLATSVSKKKVFVLTKDVYYKLLT
jgi:hypothetical protein